MPSAEAWRTGQMLWDDGVSARDIAAILGCSVALVYAHEHLAAWGRRRARARAPRVARWSCPHCHEQTASNPCGSCGRRA